MMQKKLAILCLISLIIFSGTVYAQDAFDYYIKGEECLFERTRENNTCAIEAFKEVIKLEPEMAEAYSGLAQAYAQKYQYYDKDEKWYSLAIETAIKARTVNPYIYDLPEIHIALAQAYAAKGELAEAREEYQKAINLEPEDEFVYFEFGEVNKKMGNEQEAAKAYKKAIEINPTYEPAKERLEEEKKLSLSTILIILFSLIVLIIIITLIVLKLKKKKES